MTDHPLSEFKKYIGSPLQPYLFPIIPVGAKLSSNSKLTPDHLGKIPGRYNAQTGEWAGFDWPNNRATQTQLERWEMQQLDAGASAIGLNTRWYHGLDVDSDKKEFVDAVERIGGEHFGVSPVVRCRDGSVRIVLFYKHKDHTAPIRKFRLAVEDEKDGSKYIVEFLAMGQQVVIEGPHAKGKMHYWRNDASLVDHVSELPEVDVEQVDKFCTALRDWALASGYKEIKLSLPTSSDRAAAVSIDNLMSPHLARDMDLLAKAIAAIDINHPSLADYDPWCALFRAMWAACGGSRHFYASVIWPWLQGNPANTEEEMEAKLASFHDSQLGAEYVYGIAADFGFTEGTTAIAQELFEHAPTTQSADAGGDETADGDGTGAPPGISGAVAAGAGG